MELIGIVIVAVSAILSPVASGCLNHRHARKMKEIEIREKRIQVFEKFVSDYGRWMLSDSDTDRETSGSSLFAAYLYAKQTRPQIEELMYGNERCNKLKHEQLLEIAKSLAENELR